MLSLYLKSEMFLSSGSAKCQICNVTLSQMCFEFLTFEDQLLKNIDMRSPQIALKFKGDFRSLCRECFDEEQYPKNFNFKNTDEYDNLPYLQVQYNKLKVELEQLKNQMQEREKVEYKEFTQMLNLEKLKEHSKVFEDLAARISEIYPEDKSSVSINNLQKQMITPLKSLIQIFDESLKQFFVDTLDKIETIIQQDIFSAQNKCEKLSGINYSIERSFQKEFKEGILKQENFQKMSEDLGIELKIIDKQELLERIKVVRDKILEELQGNLFQKKLAKIQKNEMNLHFK